MIDFGGEAKWTLVDKATTDLEFLASTYSSNETIRVRSTDLKDNISRLAKLREKLKADENEIHLKYLMLFRERNVFLEKLRIIEKLGKDCGWKDSQGLLKKIQGLIQTSKVSSPEKKK